MKRGIFLALLMWLANPTPLHDGLDAHLRGEYHRTFPSVGR